MYHIVYLKDSGLASVVRKLKWLLVFAPLVVLLCLFLPLWGMGLVLIAWFVLVSLWARKASLELSSFQLASDPISPVAGDHSVSS